MTQETWGWTEQSRLRPGAVGLTGAVVMSAAIMGPAVSTFFNPQFSTPFSGEATPFVGRVEELGLLARRWERARAGDGQLVLIVGEPGLGKSRLVRRVPRAARRDAAHLGRMERLAAVAEHSAASDRRMGPAALRRYGRARPAASR